jgi:hypothetical protein
MECFPLSSCCLKGLNQYGEAGCVNVNDIAKIYRHGFAFWGFQAP